MLNVYLQNLRGDEVWKAANFVNPQAGTAVEALNDRNGNQGNTIAEKKWMLNLDSIIPNDVH
jgi:hypothetical protein